MRLRIHHHGETGPVFRARIDATIARLPPSLQTRLASGGVAVHAASTLVDLLPELAHQHPRGWDAGATWRSVSGLYHPATRRIVVAEFFDFVDEPQRTRNADGILRHEVGHALDHALEGASGTRPFVERYARGVARARRDGLAALLAYYLQPGSAPGAGAEETFAELVGMVLGGGAAPDLQDLLAGAFAEARGYAAELILTVSAP